MSRFKLITGLRSRLTRHGPCALNLMLGAAIAAELAGIGWRALPLRAAAPVSGSSQRIEVANTRRGDDTRRILAAHLFGRPPAPQAESAAPRSLVLTGIIATGNSGVGFAMLGESATASRLYRSGASIGAGATLAEVFDDHVVIQYDDGRQTLRMQKRSALALLARGPGGHSVTPMAGAGDVEAVMNSLDVQPVEFENRRVALQVASSGLGVYALGAIGIHPGDTIIGVNGKLWITGDGPEDGSKIEEKFRAGGVTQLTVDREGKHVDVAVDQAGIAKAAAIYRDAALDADM